MMFATMLLCGIIISACSSSDDNSTGGGEDGGDITSGEVVMMYYSVGGGDLDLITETELAWAAYYKPQYHPNVRSFVQMKYSAKRYSKWEAGYEPSGEYGCVYRYEMNANSLNPAYKGDINKAKGFTGEGFKKIAGKDFKMYDPANLTDFINWCMKEAPDAKAYVLVFGDHGGAYDISDDYNKKMRGVMYDENLPDKPCMSPTEIATALKNTTKRINMIVFDCCLMSNLEVLGELQGATDFVFASGHVTVGMLLNTLCYHLSKIPASSDINTGIKTQMSDFTVILTNEMRKNYLNNLDEERYKRSIDFTLTDMSKIPALFSGIKKVSDYLTKYVNNLSPADLPDKTDAFDKAASECYQYVNNRPYYDIKTYLDQLKKEVFSNDTEFASLVDEVANAVKNCHVKHEEFSYDIEGKEHKYGLSYSVILGFNSKRLNFSLVQEADKRNVENQGVIMSIISGGTGEDNNPYYNNYLLENGDSYFTQWYEGQEVNIQMVNAYGKDNSHTYQSWDNTYRTLAFDKATSWSNWIKINPGIPFDNPPYDDFGNVIFEDPNMFDITGQ